MPDIDEEELRRLRGLESTVGSMLKNPKAALLMEQAHKIVDEKAPTPRLDAEKTRTEERKAEGDRIATLEKQLADDKAERERDKKLSQIQDQHTKGLAKLRAAGWLDDGIASVEKLMEDKGILDPEIAAAYIEKNTPPPEPISPGGSGSWSFFEQQAAEGGDATMKKLIESRGENNAVIDELAKSALADIRGARPRR